MKYKIIAAVCIIFVLLVAGCSGTDEPTGPSEEEQVVMDYFDERNISYGEVETDDTIVAAYIDTTGPTGEDVYNTAYSITDWKIAQEDSVYVTVYLYDNATSQQIAKGHYNDDTGRIVVE